MAKPDSLRLAILGAGPVGLEAALYARKLGLTVTIFERGRVGEYLHQWGHVRLFSPFGMNSTALGRAAIRADSPRHEFPSEADCVTGREHVLTYLDPLAESALFRECLRLDTQVIQVGRRELLKDDLPGDPQRSQEPFHLLIRQGKNRETVEEFDVVLDCTGTYGQHRWLGDGGIPAIGELAAEPQIAYGLSDVLGEHRALYAGKNILVVGSGYSAATSVCNLAALGDQDPATWVVWVARSASTLPIKRIPSDPLRERDRLAMRANTLATRADGNVEFHGQTVIEAIESAGPDKGIKVTARCDNRERIWEVDRVVANVGFTPDQQLYRELQVQESYATLGPMNLAASLLKHSASDCLQISGQGAAALRNPEPNFYILGSKSYGRNSHFLLRAGFEQVRDVFTLIMGKSNLDLYKTAS